MGGQEAKEPSAFVVTPILSHSSVRDERVSPLVYSGVEWGLELAYESGPGSGGWYAGATYAHGTLDRGGEGSPVVSSTSLALRGGWVSPLGAGVLLGLELAMTGGVRVHRVDVASAGYAEALVGLGPVVGYRAAVGRYGTVMASAGASMVTLVVRPYSDVGVARSGEFLADAGFPTEHFVGRAGLRYSPNIPGRMELAFGYALRTERIDDDDHFGRVVHALVVSVAWRNRS